MEKLRTVDVVIDDTLHFLSTRGYSSGTLDRFRCHFRLLRAYAAQTNQHEFTPHLVERFRQYLKSDASRGLPGRHPTWLAMRLLLEYEAFGTIHPKPRGYHRKTTPFFENELTAIRAYRQREWGWTQTTLKTHDYWLRRFMVFTDPRDNASDWNEFGLTRVLTFLRSIPARSRSARRQARNCLRALLKTLFVMGKIATPIHDQLDFPIPRQVMRPPVLWPDDHVRRLLAVIDRDTPLGRRDYAMFMMAWSLGLRKGDIRALRLDALCWETEKIELVQRKTGRPLELPLTREVGEALIDYLRNGRPESEAREVFLSHCPPFGPLGLGFNSTVLIEKYCLAAGIRRPHPCGFHAFRHGLATRLVGGGATLPLVSACLGHAASDVTRRYIGVHMDLLREVALDPEREVAHA